MARRTHDRAQSSDRLAKPALHRPFGFLQVAVTKTKGLFGQAAPRVQLEESTSEQRPEPPRSCRRSFSSPSLNPFRGHEQSDHAPAAAGLATHSLSANLRKSKASALGRPIISSPSFPQHLDSYDLSNPKLSYPLSPLPSPSGSSFSINSTPFPSSSKSSASDEDTAVRSVDIVIDRPVRRRTRSAPDVKPISRLAFSPALSTAYEVESFSSSSADLIGVAFPDVNTPPSPPLETPDASSDYFSRALPAENCTSPRSIISVKRKPVPRYLLVEPPNHNPSTPSTPLISLPTTPQMPAAVTSNTTSLNAPLLSESELWTSRMGRKDFSLLPIGQRHPCSRPSSSSRTRHRRSFSDYPLDSFHHTTAQQSSQIISNTPCHSAIHADTPEEERDLVLPPKGLSPPPPRSMCLPNRTPPQTPEHRATLTGDSPVNRGCSGSGALSPLTDEELQGICSFARHVDSGNCARQRRKGGRDSTRISRRSGSYDMHVKIFESYRDDDERQAAQELDAENAELHFMSSPARTEKPDGPEGAEEIQYDCVDAGQDEIPSPAEMANRGTFGYYDAPMVRNCQSRRGCNAVYAYAYIPESEASLQHWRHGCEDDDDVPEAQDSFDLSDVLACPESTPFVQNLLVAEEFPGDGNAGSSSLFSRSSSDFMVYGNDEYNMDRRPFSGSRNATSDSESDRPISCYSSTTSELASSSASDASASSLAIGVAIIPPELLARFNVYNERSAFSMSSCEYEEDVDGTPTTVACSSPVQDSFEIGDLSTSFDRLQTRLARSGEPDYFPQNNIIVRPSVVPCVLKPALRIESDASTSSSAEFPSPTETCVSSPYQPFSPKSRAMMTPDWKYQRMEACGPYGGGGGVSSTDESSVQGSVTSFMHMTPNDPPSKKRSGTRLRQFLSRTNLRLGAGRKGSSTTLKV